MDYPDVAGGQTEDIDVYEAIVNKRDTRSFSIPAVGSLAVRASSNEGVTEVVRGERPRRNMRKLIATFMASAILVFGGVACDDNNNASDKIDEDDTNFGPGDGKDEVGPGR